MNKKLDRILCPLYFVLGTAMLVVGIIALVRGVAVTGGVMFFVLVIGFYYVGFKTLLKLRANDYEGKERGK